MNQTIVACDPGVNGGFAVKTQDRILLFPMPESVPDIHELLMDIKLSDSHIWIEKVPKFVSKLTPAAAVATTKSANTHRSCPTTGRRAAAAPPTTNTPWLPHCRRTHRSCLMASSPFLTLS